MTRPTPAGRPVGGTSCGAPLWAAITALINQERTANGSTTIGLVNNAFYSIAQSGSYHSDFHDIADNSNNLFYHAEAGFDDATGLGSLNGANLALDPLVSGVKLTATLSGTVTSSQGNAPIAGAAVSVLSSGSQEVLQTTVTLADGTYSVAAPPGVAVDVQATELGYYSQQNPVTSPAAGDTLNGVDFPLVPSPAPLPSGASSSSRRPTAMHRARA